MPGKIPKPTRISHITHFRNLPSIIAGGGLQCVADLRRLRANYVDIAHQNIQDRRTTTVVPLLPGGHLHDYVPFHFTVRPPMLYPIKNGRVEGYNEGQSPVIYLVTSVHTVSRSRLPFLFTDGHATMAYTKFYDDLNDLSKIDWNMIDARYWHEIASDLDRKRRIQAEFLVYRFIAWNLIRRIAVIDNQWKTKVENLIDGAPHLPAVVVKPAWYY